MNKNTANWIARVCIVLAACAGTVNVAHAVPASPDPFLVEQPDGSSFQAYMRGDEFQGWTETADGYTLVRNQATGFFDYASQGPAGELVPSGIAVTSRVASQMAAEGRLPQKGLRPPRNTELEQFQGRFLDAHYQARVAEGMKQADKLTGTWAPTPVSGPKKILMILVNFQDATLSANSATYWSNAVHDLSASSVAKYFQDNSFGTISIAPVTHTQAGGPVGVVTVNLAQNHPNCNKNCSFATESGWINSALAAAAPYVNFPALDADANGTISVDEALIYFVLAGYEASAGSSTPSIWAHAWGGPGVAVSGKNVDHWALNGERYNATELMRMGVVAHEMGHAMGGLPDLYDTSGSNAGLGIFSLMAAGSWGRRTGEIGGTTPVGLDAWSRQYLGWATPQTPANGSSVSFVSGLSSPNSAVMLINEASSSSEYWLVENRPPVGWDAGMASAMGTWTGGLVIQHIDLNVGTRSANSFNRYVSGGHQGNMAEEPSTATCSLRSTTSSSSGCRTIFYYSGNATTFDGTSTPNSNYYSGTASGVGLSAISAPGSTMTATVQTAAGGTSTFTLNVTKAGAGTGTVSSTPTGINCGTTCAASFNPGTIVTLLAAATSGSTFEGWGGACSGTSASCQVTMSQSRSVTATFGASTTPLTSGLAVGNLSGAVNSTQYFYIDVPSGATSLTVQTTGGTGDADLYVRRDSLPTTATFDCRSYGDTAAENCAFTNPAAGRYYVLLHAYAAFSGVSLTATYVAAASTYTLAVTKSGTGSGTVSSSPTGISCGATCSTTFNAGVTVTLTASATSGSTFSGWGGACSGTAATCQVAMSQSRTVTATFDAAASIALTNGQVVSNLSGAAGNLQSYYLDVPSGATSLTVLTTGTGELDLYVRRGSEATTSAYDCRSWNSGSVENCAFTNPAAGRFYILLYGYAAYSGATLQATYVIGSTTYTLGVTKAGTGTGTVVSTPAGIDCGATCSASFVSGATVVLAATATSGSTFAGWSGACTGTGTCSVTMSAASSVTATFNTGTPTTYALSVARSGTGSGTVISSPAGIDCGSVCTASFSSGTVVTLTATAVSGSAFAGWSGACTGTGACTVTMSAAKSVGATFNTSAPTTFALTVSRTGAGTGAVASNPAGINCGSTCTASFGTGTVVALTATAATGSTFSGWTGACSGTGVCSVTMDAAKSVSAAFNAGSTPLTNGQVVSGLSAAVGVSRSYYIDVPSGVTSLVIQTTGGTGDLDLYVRRDVPPDTNTYDCAPYTSVAAETCSFSNPAAGRYYILLDAFTAYSGVSLQASYATSTGAFALAVTKAGTGTGTVTSSPTGINCGAACSASFSAGTVVTLAASADAGSTFAGWSGGGCSGSSGCTVTMSAAKTVTATFNSSSPSATRLSNLSTRGQVQTGDNVMIGGFIVGGSAPKKVLIRARGPSLAAFGVAGVIPDTVLQLYSGQTVIASNDDWQRENSNVSEIQASGFAPTDELESAILTTLNPGPYTAIVSGYQGAVGVGIIEVFELDRPDIPLTNLSTRGRVLTGDNVMIGGFVITGTSPKTVLITARGPSLTAFGVAGALSDPTLVLYSGQTQIASNGDWGSASNAAAILATGRAPTNSLESAILVTLNPGAYTAIVSGLGGATGVAIVEVFAQ